MSKTAEKSDPELWDKVKDEVTAGDKGGKPGQWSARKAQMASAEYQKRGGGYKGEKSKNNHLQEWTDEDWGTKSGHKSEDTGERYLPKEAREALTNKEYARTSAKKRADTTKGKQYSAQPEDIAEKTAEHRDMGKADKTKAELYEEAKAKDLAGRSTMSKAQLAKALS